MRDVRVNVNMRLKYAKAKDTLSYLVELAYCLEHISQFYRCWRARRLLRAADAIRDTVRRGQEGERYLSEILGEHYVREFIDGK